MLQNRSDPDVQEKRRQWVENIPKLDVNKIVFLDESGANTDMVRRYGRSRVKTRVVDHAPLNTPKSTTIVSSMRRNGATAFATLRGSMNGERFIAYLEETLIPTLETGDYVVMDNLGSHHVKGVEEWVWPWRQKLAQQLAGNFHHVQVSAGNTHPDLHYQCH